MLHVLNKTTSIADQFLMELRDIEVQKDRARFRGNLERLGSIMAVLLTVLRAGIPFYSGFLRIFDRADTGFIGAMRVEDGTSITIKMDYVATPDLNGRDVLLIDPMLATGKSITDSVGAVLRNGTPRHVHIASLIAAQAGIDHVEKNVGIPHTIWTFAVDPKLNDLFYIVPGLGDAGDLSFGDKL